MKPFEFVLVITSVVIALALAEFASMVGYMIQNYRVSTLSVPYLALMIAGLAGGLNYWGTVYLLRKVSEWNNLKMGLLFLTGLTYYATARVFIPDPMTFDNDYVQFFHENISTAFAMMICFVFSVVVESLILRKGRPKRWYFIMSIFVLLMLSGIFIDNHQYREVLAFVILALQGVNLAVNRVVIVDK